MAPSGNQAATENTNFCLTVGEDPAYSPDQGQDQFAKPRAELSGKLPVRVIDPDKNLAEPVRGPLQAGRDLSRRLGGVDDETGVPGGVYLIRWNGR